MKELHGGFFEGLTCAEKGVYPFTYEQPQWEIGRLRS